MQDTGDEKSGFVWRMKARKEEKMEKKKIGRLLALVFALVIVLPVGRLYAEGYETTVSIPFEIQLKDGKESDRVPFTVQLMAQEDAPLPEETKCTVEGSGAGTFGPIRYEKPGEYVYHLKQIPGAQEKIIYDSMDYRIEVFVSNNEDGSTLEYAMNIYAGEAAAKSEKIVFTNGKEVPKVVEKTIVEKKAPTTGDTFSLVVPILLIVLAGGAFLLIQKKKAHNKRG